MVSLAQCALCDESPATSPSLLFVLLPCLHSLCTLCLGDVRSEQEGHRRNKHYYPCPSCHETFDCYDDVHVLEAGPGRPEQDEHEAAQEEPLLGDKTIEALEEHRDKVLLAIGDVEAQRRHQQALLVSLPQEIADHARLRFAKGEAAKHYNALQKLTYFLVIFGLGPLVVLTGLTMSPTMDAAFPFLPWLFGGRQSARTIHFLCAFSFLGFFIIHIVMVVLSGTWNNVRSMITGRYAIEPETGHG